MERKIIMAGFGGQGIMAMGQLLTYAGMLENKNVTWMPSYGPEMRGGAANCSVIISDDPVGAPNILKATDVIAMNKPSLDKFEESVIEGGNLFINTSLISAKAKRDDLDVYNIPATSLAKEMGLDKASNMVMLGAFLAVTKIVKEESVLEAFKKVFGDKKVKFIPLNKEAMQLGKKAAMENNEQTEQTEEFRKTPEEFAKMDTDTPKVRLDIQEDVFADDMKIAKQALENKKRSVKYYQTMQKKFEKQETSKVFETIAHQSLEHVDYLNGLIELLEGKKDKLEAIDKQEMKDYNWQEMDTDTDLVLSALSIGMELSESIGKFYKKALEKTENSDIKKLFEQLVYWENFQYEQIKGQYDLYKSRWWADQSYSPF